MTLAIRELERCVTELGLPGVQIGTHVNGANLDDPALFPVFERASELGAAVFVHPWDMLGGERMPKYWLRWLVGVIETVESLQIPAPLADGVAIEVLGGRHLDVADLPDRVGVGAAKGRDAAGHGRP